MNLPNNALYSVFRDFIHLLYPQPCMSCWEKTVEKPSHFCLDCIVEIPYTDHFENEKNSMLRHFYGRLEVKHVAALIYFSEGSVVQKMMHKYKYEAKKEIGTVLGNIAGQKIVASPYFKEVDIIVPIPLFYKKEGQRGYNQSEVFGHAISKIIDKPISVGNFRKVTPTDSQTSKNRTDRQINIKNSFGILHPKQFYNKHILIVDDVVTTGATLEACGNLLLENGAREISIISIAEAS